MESKNTLTLLTVAIFLSLPLTTFGQWDQLKKKVQQRVEETLDGDNEGRTAKLIAKFERGQPISTTFDDAIYEADFLGNFEPQESDYRPLDIQPRAEKGGYKLKSGLYSMNAKSFCLRGYTYGPSKGDGHLYAPMKGKKADFVQSIIQRYGQKPEIPQQDVQVLLWAIISGTDMNTLGTQHAKTLNALFTAEELLRFRGKDWLNGIAEKQFDDLKREIIGRTPPQLQALLDADNKIRTMVKENKSFQEIERVAIIAGVAPRDMIRDVSKGAWSYHPDGYFVRFFPNGYQQTRVDVFVPFQGAVQTDAKGKAIEINTESETPKEVAFDPSGMVASPANRPSQRIGVSPVPVNPTPLHNKCPEYLSPVLILASEISEINKASKLAGFPDASYPYAEKPNGCGAADSWKSILVPGGFLGLADFTSACDCHDKCYSTSDDKEKCDTEFFNALIDACPISMNCVRYARIYRDALKEGGTEPYQRSRKLQKEYENWLKAYKKPNNSKEPRKY